jgi:hypothetical protein
VTRPHRYEPDVNATFAEMAAHYGVAVIPARAYKPREYPEYLVIPRIVDRCWSAWVRPPDCRDNYVSAASWRIISSSPFQMGTGSGVLLAARWTASRTIWLSAVA